MKSFFHFEKHYVVLHSGQINRQSNILCQPDNYKCQILDKGIQKLYAWYCCNKLLLNVQKTKCVIFRSKGKKLPDGIIFLCVGGHDVAPIENVQFLWLTMDEHLSWRNHLDAVCTKLSRSVGVIFRLKYILPERVLITLYNIGFPGQIREFVIQIHLSCVQIRRF